jgi:uncharacterized protein with HEPN domain
MTVFIPLSGIGSCTSSYMSEKRSANLLLFDISRSIEKIEGFTRDISFDQLMSDERTKDAVHRNLQVIGEASKSLPASIVTHHPEVDWSGLAGVRDIITHRYFRVDWNLLLSQYPRRTPCSENADWKTHEGRTLLIPALSQNEPFFSEAAFRQRQIPGEPRASKTAFPWHTPPIQKYAPGPEPLLE